MGVYGKPPFLFERSFSFLSSPLDLPLLLCCVLSFRYQGILPFYYSVSVKMLFVWILIFSFLFVDAFLFTLSQKYGEFFFFFSGPVFCFGAMYVQGFPSYFFYRNISDGIEVFVGLWVLLHIYVIFHMSHQQKSALSKCSLCIASSKIPVVQKLARYLNGDMMQNQCASAAQRQP